MKKLNDHAPSSLALLLVGIVLTYGGGTACDGRSAKTDPTPQEQPAPSTPPTETTTSGASGELVGPTKNEKPAATEKVVVDDAGTKFDPSVSVARLPAGAWACDMGGQSHYAAGEKGDGKCEVCGMALKHIGSTAEVEAGPKQAAPDAP